MFTLSVRLYLSLNESLTYASLPPDALKAFEMNKPDGEKQHLQQDTVILQSNPDPQFCGQPQLMTTATGEAEGLKAILEEHGFNVTKLKAKCSPLVLWMNF